MFSNTNGAYTRPASTVGYGKGFMQIKVRYIATELSRRTEPNHGVEIGAINIDLTSVLVHDIANFSNRCLECPMS